jgi:hypothetical protein
MTDLEVLPELLLLLLLCCYVADNGFPLFLLVVRCLKWACETEYRFCRGAKMLFLDMPRRIVFPRERGLASILTVFAAVNGAMVPWKQLMGVHVTLEIS